MPLRNRVTPLGDLIADPARGLVYGNRGCLHDDAGTIRRHHAGRRWIACRLGSAGGIATRCCNPAGSPSCSSWTTRRRWPPAIARAPCAAAPTTSASRRSGGRCIPTRWARTRSIVSSIANASVRGPSKRSLHAEHAADLPDGTFVLRDGDPYLVLGPRLLRWTPAGYGAAAAPEAGTSTCSHRPRSSTCCAQAGTRSSRSYIPRRSAERPHQNGFSAVNASQSRSERRWYSASWRSDRRGAG